MSKKKKTTKSSLDYMILYSRIHLLVSDENNTLPYCVWNFNMDIMPIDKKQILLFAVENSVNG